MLRVNALPMNSSMSKQLMLLAGALLVLGLVLLFGKVGGVTPVTITDNLVPSVEVPAVGPITIEGMIVCLPHANTTGPQTTECAYGLKDTAGRYYALRDTDPGYKNISAAPTNASVEVRGTFAPADGGTYQSIGVIEVTSVGPAGVSKQESLSGTYRCLPHADGSALATNECAYGIETAAGDMYALDLRLVSNSVPQIAAGDTFSAQGIVVPADQLNTDAWQKYPIKGIFSVAGSVMVKKKGVASGKTGYIFGKVLLGPTCPVERNPPDPQCADKPYETDLFVYGSDMKSVVAKLHSGNPVGSFSATVPVGSYYVGPVAGAKVLPRCSMSDKIVVTEGATTSVSISCDSGIR